MSGSSKSCMFWSSIEALDANWLCGSALNVFELTDSFQGMKEIPDLFFESYFFTSVSWLEVTEEFVYSFYVWVFPAEDGMNSLKVKSEKGLRQTQISN